VIGPSRAVREPCSLRTRAGRKALGASFALLVVLLVGGVLISAACNPFRRPTGSSASASASVAPPVPASTPLVTKTVVAAPGAAVPQSFADLAAKADPAVVFVETRQVQTGRTGRRRVVAEGLGSGFVYDPSGLILTNNHVITEATKIQVTFKGNRQLEAKVVGTDPKTDIAVLRVDANGLPLGDSDAIRVGDWVVAIGNPFGLSHTVSAGIVSAKGRTKQDVKGLGDPTGYYDFLQTDASINPGNSGGPLLDTAGRVVGVNTAIRANANSIGFAIPINMVKELLPHLIREGKVRRSAIGIEILSVNGRDAQRLGISRGALVKRVLAGGPGDRAGIQVDDVIIGFQGTPVEGPEQLRWQASLAGVGKRVAVRVQRGKREFDLWLVLGELDSGEEPQPGGLFELPDPFH
jgi:serine protease Do